MSSNDINTLIERYNELTQEIKILKGEQEILADTLKKQLDSEGIEVFEDSAGKVSWTEQVRISYPKSLLEKEFTKKQLARVSKMIKTKVFRVTGRKE